MSDDDDLPGEARDPTQAGYPDQNPEDGPGLKDRHKPRKKSRPSENVATVIMNYFSFLLLGKAIG